MSPSSPVSASSSPSSSQAESPRWVWFPNVWLTSILLEASEDAKRQDWIVRILSRAQQDAVVVVVVVVCVVAVLVFVVGGG
jgi:hypothetical protein